MGDQAIVVGGGVVGCSIARELCRDGWRVALYDQGPLFGETSTRAAGLLGFESQAHEMDFPLWLDQARDMWEPWLRQLERETDLSSGYGTVGIMRLIETAERLEEVQERISGLGRAAQVVSSRTMEWLHSHAAGETAGGLHFSTDARVDPSLLGEVLSAAIAKDGVDVHAFEAIEALVWENGRVTGVHSRTGSHRADLVVLAGGWQSPSLLLPLGRALPIVPVRGQVMGLARPNWWPPYTVQTEDWYAIPREDGSLVVGSTWEEQVTEAVPTLSGVAKIAAAVMKKIPALESAAVLTSWAGIRPVTADDMPYMGAIPGLDGLIVATGHGHNGVMLAPWTGRSVAAMARGEGRPEWQPFSPSRLF